MTQSMRRLALGLLIVCLLAALAGCRTVYSEPVTAPVLDGRAPTTIVPSNVDLEINGKTCKGIYVYQGAAYVEATMLAEALGLELSEPAEGTLVLAWEGNSLRFREGDSAAKAADDSLLALPAPAILGNASWYLPLDTVDALWNRYSFYQQSTNCYRSLRLAPGPEIRLNGQSLGSGLLLDDWVLLPAETLVKAAQGSSSVGTYVSGDATLTLELWGRKLELLDASSAAALDGEWFTLPAPVCLRPQGWYLPAEALEALGCRRSQTGDALELWKLAEGPTLWLEGRCLGPALSLGETACASLSQAAEVLGAQLREDSETVTLTWGSHRLVFRPGTPRFEADGKETPLPVSPLADEAGLLVPVEPLAQALGLSRMEGEALAYSRLEPRETVLYAEGRPLQSWGLPEQDSLYFRLGELLDESADAPVLEGSQLRLSLFGKALTLEGGSAEALVDGEPVNLSGPAYGCGADWYLPASLLGALGLTELQDPELDQVYYTKIVKNDSLAEGHRIPVLMYHAVSDYTWGIPELFVSPAKLEEQLQAMEAGGYTAVTFEDLDHIQDIEKPVMLTFDDGYDDNYTELFPLLKKYNVKATVFVIVNDLGKNHKLTREQVKEMSDSGLVSIQSHTMSHNYLDWMNDSQLEYEHYNSMLELARITGKQPFVMCYPTGKCSAHSRSVTEKYYQYGLCMGGTCYVTGAAPYLIYRYYIPRNTSLSTFLKYLEG